MKGEFKINMAGVGPTIELDGQSFDNLAEVRIVHRHGEFPAVYAVFDAHEVKIEGQGNVELGATGESPAQFLDRVDVKALTSEALGKTTFDQSPMEAFVQLLKERARGD